MRLSRHITREENARVQEQFFRLQIQELPSEARDAQLPSSPSEDRLLTIPEVAQILGIGRTAAYELARRPDFSMVRLSGHKGWRVSRQRLQQWITGTLLPQEDA